MERPQLGLMSAGDAVVRQAPARNAIISMAPYTTSPEPATRARPGRPLPTRWTAIHPPTITTLTRPVIPTTGPFGPTRCLKGRRQSQSRPKKWIGEADDNEILGGQRT